MGVGPSALLGRRWVGFGFGEVAPRVSSAAATTPPRPRPPRLGRAPHLGRPCPPRPRPAHLGRAPARPRPPPRPCPAAASAVPPAVAHYPGPAAADGRPVVIVKDSSALDRRILHDVLNRSVDLVSCGQEQPQVATARLWRSAPPSGGEQHRDLGCHRARVAHHVPPAVTQGSVAGDCRPIVPTIIAEFLVRRMCLSTVEFDDRFPLRVANIAVHAAAAWALLATIAHTAG